MTKEKKNTEHKFTDRQQRFIEEYTVDCNKTQAAIRAGYAKEYAAQEGSRLYRNVKIREAIKKRLDELAMSAEEALKRLADIAQSDLSPFYVEREIERDGRKFKFMDLDLTTEDAQQNLHKIKAIVPSQHGTKIVLHDQQSALETILKAHGRLKDHVTQTTFNFDLSELSDEELERVQNGEDPEQVYRDSRSRREGKEEEAEESRD